LAGKQEQSDMVSSKRGSIMSYPHPSYVSKLGATWLHTWSADPPIYPGIESVPLLFASDPMPTEIGGNSPHVLTFNEPDSTNMVDPDPEINMTRCLELWHWMETESSYQHMLLWSPSVTSQRGDATHLLGQTWLEQFRQRYHATYGTYPLWAGLGCHIYPSGYAGNSPVRQFTAFVEEINWYIFKAREWGCRFGVWINEWAFVPCWTSHETALASLKLAQPWLEQQHDVFRYAWFEASFAGGEEWAFHPHLPPSDPAYYTVCNSSLVGWNTAELTDYGRAYVGGED
jgi:hypothetical protein